MWKNNWLQNKNQIGIPKGTSACDKCFKDFSNKTSLKRHFATVHLEIKSYKCDKCPKSFGQKGTLNIHKNSVHLGLKNYKCDQCSKTFSQSGPLQIHIKKVIQKSKPSKMVWNSLLQSTNTYDIKKLPKMWSMLSTSIYDLVLIYVCHFHHHPTLTSYN